MSRFNFLLTIGFAFFCLLMASIIVKQYKGCAAYNETRSYCREARDRSIEITRRLVFPYVNDLIERKVPLDRECLTQNKFKRNAPFWGAIAIIERSVDTDPNLASLSYFERNEYMQERTPAYVIMEMASALEDLEYGLRHYKDEEVALLLYSKRDRMEEVLREADSWPR
ncbi:MAG: hypothetical protein PHH17_02330 [Candidatus Pacebacteria bacterium]|nr:hypothetical protein [Candidatus Paceibacterota bacterium]MDD3072222.1 hypothetical protein [Candidatus Paceibacterota bacterium]MDD4201179.1 hypothetical protein [Candidatus Paceibacterota bacterium]MDD4897244.1 hypothetical protein [Candidatus Paceibacterota bacterium]MDD5446017.1 hypothetical protein [Candidatus Paceibacterota bacterium]